MSKNKFSLINLFVVPLIFVSCSIMEKCKYYEIKVFPDEFAIIKLCKSEKMRLKYKDHVIDCGEVGKYYYPITITKLDEIIYIIKIDIRGEKLSEYRSEFYKQKDNSLMQISPSEFPRKIAVKNVWLPGNGKTIDKNGNIVRDHLQINRDMNINDLDFRSCETAALWYHLEKGVPYMEVAGTLIDDVNFFQNYMTKYKPVQLNIQELKPISKEDAGF